MSFKPEYVFDVMLCMYRSGLLDAVSSVQGEALQQAMDEAGLNMGDLTNRADQAGGETIAKLDRLLGMSGPLLRLAARETPMRLAARLLGVAFVRRRVVSSVKTAMLKAFTGEPGALPAGAAREA